MSLRGAAARHPAWDATLGKPLTLAGRINQCRVRHVKVPPLAPESEGLLALEAFVALQSRGLPIAPDRTPALQPFVAQGEALYRRRIGQLDFSCAQCHDERAGQRLGGSVIPQGHATGYPIYRLEWQGMGSLQRRLVSWSDFAGVGGVADDLGAQVPVLVFGLGLLLAFAGAIARHMSPLPRARHS